MTSKPIFQKITVSIAMVVMTMTLAACGGGSSSSSKSRNNCINIESASGGVNVTNSCGFKVNVAFFDPLFRFSLEENETKFLARSGLIQYGACKAPSKPKELRDSTFFCD